MLIGRIVGRVRGGELEVVCESRQVVDEVMERLEEV